MTNQRVSLDTVATRTNKFFGLHWPTNTAGWDELPKWSSPWRFEGELPNNSKQGVYALLDEGGGVLYIGVGASLGSGRYEGAGLGSRINQHCRLAEKQPSGGVRKYRPSPEWEKRGRDENFRLDAIATLGFEPEQAYLAYALEVYLISRIEPPCNKTRPGRPSTL